MFLSGFWNAFASLVRNPLPTINTFKETFYPQQAQCQINLFNDGSLSYTDGTLGTVSDQWAVTIASGIGSSYWARLTVAAGGDNPTSGSAVGTWVSLASTVNWTWTQPVSHYGEKLCTFTLDIASDSGGVNIVGSGSGSADALEDAP